MKTSKDAYAMYRLLASVAWGSLMEVCLHDLGECLLEFRRVAPGAGWLLSCNPNDLHAISEYVIENPLIFGFSYIFVEFSSEKNKRILWDIYYLHWSVKNDKFFFQSSFVLVFRVMFPLLL